MVSNRRYRVSSQVLPDAVSDDANLILEYVIDRFVLSRMSSKASVAQSIEENLARPYDAKNLIASNPS